MVKTIPDNELRRMWEEFLTDYDYPSKLVAVASTGDKNLEIEINASELEGYSPYLFDCLMEEPDRIIRLGRETICKYYLGREGKAEENLNLRIINTPEKTYVSITTLGSKYIGHFVSVKGTVKNIMEIHPKLIEGAFRCENCGAIIRQKQEGNIIVKPIVCYEDQGGCGKKAHFTLEDKLSSFTDSQLIEIQEMTKNSGNPPTAKLSAYLTDDLAGKISLGEAVILNGTLRASPQSKRQAKNTFDLYLEVNSFERSDESNRGA